MHCSGVNLFWHLCYKSQFLGPQPIDYNKPSCGMTLTAEGGRSSCGEQPFGSRLEPSRAKTDPKILVVVISKEGLAGASPGKPPLGMTPSMKLYMLYSVVFSDYIL